MKTLFFFLTLWLSFVGFSQDETNIPVLLLESPCFKTRQQISFDSVAQISTRIKVYSVDYNDHCVPAVYRVTKTQLDPVPYYLLAFAHCDTEEQVHRMGFRTPDSCFYYQKPDANHVFNASQSKTGETVKLDSFQMSDINCAQAFYEFENDSVQADTIYSKHYVDNDYSMDSQFLWHCDYYYDVKHGEELAYYSVQDVQGICITGKAPMVKYKGYWRDGKKNSWWIYYLPNGEVDKTEKYRNGKLKKTLKIEY